LEKCSSFTYPSGLAAVLHGKGGSLAIGEERSEMLWNWGGEDAILGINVSVNILEGVGKKYGGS